MLPPVLMGRRRTMFWRLLLSGLAQAAIALTCSGLLALVLKGNLESGMLLPIAGLILAATVTVGLRRLESAEAERLGQDYVIEVRLALFEATLRDGGTAQRHGIAMARMITDLTSLKNWVSLGLARVLVSALALAGGVTALWVSSPGLAPWGSALVITILGTAGVLAIPLRNRIRAARKYRGRLAARVGELTRASDTLYQFDAVAGEARRIKRMSIHIADALAARRGLIGLIRGLPEMIVPLAAALFVMAAMADSTLSTYQPAVALLIIGFMAQPLRDLVGAFDYWLVYLESRRRLAPLLAQADQHDSPATVLRPGSANHAEEVLLNECGVLAHPKFDGLTRDTGRIVVTPGVVTAEIGTLADTEDMPARLRAMSGLSTDIADCPFSLAGEPINDWSPAMRRKRIKLVSRSLPLLRRSVERNMRDLVPGTSSDDVARLLRELGLADDPEFRLLGQRKLGELGRGLSESLDARLRLVRAVLSKPDIIVTDDRVFLYDAAARAALERSAEVNGIAVIVMLQPIVAVPSTWLPKNSAHDASNLEVNTVN